MQARILLAFIIALFAACTSAEDKALAEIKEKEEALNQADSASRAPKMQEALTYLWSFPDKFPESKEAPGMLYKAAQLQNELKQYDSVIITYKKLAADYPDFKAKDDVLPGTYELVIKGKEAAFKVPNASYDRDKLRDLASTYEDFARFFPESEAAPKRLYSSAELHFSLGEHDAALEIFEQITTGYPDYRKEKVLFMKGYVNDDKGRLEKAKELYEKFLQLYPGHELASTVQFSLENLGKPAEEIIKEKGWDKQKISKQPGS